MHLVRSDEPLEEAGDGLFFRLAVVQLVVEGKLLPPHADPAVGRVDPFDDGLDPPHRLLTGLGEGARKGFRVADYDFVLGVDG